MRCSVLLLAFMAVAVRTAFIEDTITYGYFPKDFIWAAATASYQVEGAWNVDGIMSFLVTLKAKRNEMHSNKLGRSPSIWDTFSRIPNNIADGSSGDDACKSYYYYKKDVELLKAMGVSR